MTIKKRLRIAGIWLGAVFLSQMAIANAQQQNNQQIAAGDTPIGISVSDWQSIRQQMSQHRYSAFPQENGSYTAENIAHGWQIDYAQNGRTTLMPLKQNADAYFIGLQLTSLGYQKQSAVTVPARITSDNTTLNYHWDNNVTEIWTNTADSLEQWFEIQHKPQGAAAHQPLTLQLAITTDLHLSQQGNTLYFTDNKNQHKISYNKLKVWDSQGTEIAATMQLDKAVLSLVIADQLAVYPLTIDPSFQDQAYLKASNADADDFFGEAVAVSGDTVVVGAVGRGAAYIFNRVGSHWFQQAYLTAPQSATSSFFGTSVAISGETVAVGASGEARSAPNFHTVGDVYVFTRSGLSWSEQAYLQAHNVEAGDFFGISVAISGDTLVVGAAREDSHETGTTGATGVFGFGGDDNLAENAGAAYIFTRTGSNWHQQAYLKASNTGLDDNFGISVSISGNTVVVGAYGESSNATGVNGNETNDLSPHSGAAYVFNRVGGSWSQQAYLKASNTDTSDRFGDSVAISGDTIVIGAWQESSNATGVNGDQSDTSATAAGAAYVFKRQNSSNWSQQAYLKASNTQPLDRFGRSVAISGEMIVVAAASEDSGATGSGGGGQADNSVGESGAAYVFTRSKNSWTQQSYLKASNTGIGDAFGLAVAIADRHLVVGALSEDSANIEGDNSEEDAGAAYLFDRTVVDDNYEANNMPETAYDFSAAEQTLLSTLNGAGIQSNQDWYKIHVNQGFRNLVVNLTFSDALGDIDLALYDADGLFITSRTTASDNELLETILPDGNHDYYLKVYYENAGNSYDLKWDDEITSSGFEAGDANRDGDINIQDVIAIINMILNSAPYKQDADCNVDEKIDIQDVICTINKVLAGA
jgi:hypothetical protein